MPSRARWMLLTVLLAVFAATVLVAGRAGEPAPLLGVQRLGPEAGEPVAGYLRRAHRSLPPAGTGPVWALVQLNVYLEPAAAARLISNRVRLSAVVLRVPLPDVQTALTFRDVPGQRPVGELATAIRVAGQQRAWAAAQAAAGSRASAVAAAEAARLRRGCACVLALLVRAEGDALRALAAQPMVRVVHAADSRTPRQGLAISPLLPEQHVVVAPVPDDGPVPAETPG